MNKKEQLLEIKTKLAKLYGSKCAICGSKHIPELTFHHIWYENSDKTWKDFTNTLAYYEYLQYVIIARPKQFKCLCNKHHQAVTRISRYNKQTLKKIIKIARLKKPY